MRFLPFVHLFFCAFPVDVWGAPLRIDIDPSFPEWSAWVLATLGLPIVLRWTRRGCKAAVPPMPTAGPLNHNCVRTALSTWILFLATFATLCWPSKAAAEVVFDTFGPGDSYNEDFKYGGGGQFHFQPANSGVLKNITVALGRASTETTHTTFTLLEDIDLTFFFVLETWIIPNETPPLPSPGAVVTFDSLAMPTLLADHSYWLAFSDPGPFPANSLWFMNNQGIGQDIFPFTTTMPAFRIETVPEPHTAGMLIVGVALLACPAVRRKLAPTSSQ